MLDDAAIASAEQSKQMQRQSEQMDAVIANNAALVAEVAALKEDKASLRNDMDALAGAVATLMAGVKNLTAAAAEAEEAKNNAPSNVVYGNDFHPGGHLDFTPGSASLAILEQTLVGVKVFLSAIFITGTDIQGSVLSRLLKDATSIGGGLYCSNNVASFEVGNAELVFESLASVTEIRMYTNNDESKQRFTGASFPALTFVPNIMQLQGNPMLETISMPKLVRVGDDAHFCCNAALTSLQLPSLVTVGTTFAIGRNPSLATGKVQVSQDFESVGGTFQAYDMLDGFECTSGNGLSAVVAAVSSSWSTNAATCKQ